MNSQLEEHTPIQKTRLYTLCCSACFGLGASQCPPNTASSDVDAVRLTGLLDGSFRGGAEVSMGGRWGVMCDSDYTDNEAMTLCRQLQCEGGI